RFDIGWSEPLHLDGRIPGKSGRGPARVETGKRDGDRPLGPPQHHVTARPFREGACRLIPAYPPRPKKNLAQLTFNQQALRRVSLVFSKTLWPDGHAKLMLWLTHGAPPVSSGESAGIPGKARGVSVIADNRRAHRDPRFGRFPGWRLRLQGETGGQIPLSRLFDAGEAARGMP